MFDMGLAGMGGAAGAGDATNLLFQQRMDAARLKQQDDQFKAQLAQQDALTRLKAQEVSEATRARVESQQQLEASRKETERQHNLTMLSGQLNEIPTDAPISGQTMGRMTEAGITPERFAPVPITTPAPPSSIAALGDSWKPEPVPGTEANSPAPNLVQFHRIPTAAEVQHQKDEADKIAAQRNPVADHAANRAFDAAHPLPHEAPSVVIQTVDANGNPITKIVPKTVGTEFAAKPTAQMQTHEMAKGEASDVLNQLDQALNDAKDLVGPGQGRISNVEELIGNQDPRLNTLGTKMLAAKVKVNAALTPSARASMTPAALAAWDNLLANKITPEGLKATIQAMRDVVGKTPAGSSASGAHKKYNPATGKLE